MNPFGLHGPALRLTAKVLRVRDEASSFSLDHLARVLSRPVRSRRNFRQRLIQGTYYHACHILGVRPNEEAW